MKIVNYLPTKANKWAVVLDENGSPLTGWVMDHMLKGSLEYCKQAVSDAKEFIRLNPVCPPDPGIAPSYTHDRAAYEDWSAKAGKFREWHLNDRRKNYTACEKMPIFEDTLVFDGYSKGQSSFTLDFIDSNGRTIKFGPKSTGALVKGIIEGNWATIVDVVDHAGKPEARRNADNSDWIRDERSRSNEAKQFPTFFTGKALNIQFFMVKQGENIYAHLYEGHE